jgi:hypothetical protein
VINIESTNFGLGRLAGGGFWEVENIALVMGDIT